MRTFLTRKLAWAIASMAVLGGVLVPATTAEASSTVCKTQRVMLLHRIDGYYELQRVLCYRNGKVVSTTYRLVKVRTRW